MRPLRLLLSLSTSLVALTLLLYMVVGTSQNEEQERISVASSRGSFKAMFSSPFPSSLFPPSAIISLTDDNSTFFLARPAAFGPALPKGGLSGSLWIGSGFGDDTMGAGGELGCSDVPGWEDGNDDFIRASRPSGRSKEKAKDTKPDRILSPKGGVPDVIEDNTKDAVADDGTDDHLQPGLSNTRILPRSKHADIQSLQESAEIAGKVVLLKRGGCGFLAKVQWAQSRGGVAVIVGDDVRGGALVRMYAKGDTSNITIPSLFTSHTTAHLLSSLYPGDGMLSDSAQASHASAKGHWQGQDIGDYATLSEAPQVVHTSAHGKQTSEGQRTSWLHSFLSAFGYDVSNDSPKAGSRRLPNSGDLEWVEVSEWEDDQNPIKTKSAAPTAMPTKLADGFVIGEHDWRDPDLLRLTATTIASIEAASATPISTKAGSNAIPGSAFCNSIQISRASVALNYCVRDPSHVDIRAACIS
ncbi:hypothetical protein J4E91_000006 [Alternaria rosae]|nr:hypothetical protein J4E91_000006 [Alternaria rosae]